MIKAVLFDVGGTLHTVSNTGAMRTAFARRLKERLEIYGIHIGSQAEELGRLLHENAEAYKRWSEGSLRELPQPRIWNEYYLRQYEIGESRLAPIAEELSFRYDYERVCLTRRPNMVRTIETLHGMGLALGIISNIISTSFVPHILKEYGIDRYMSCVVLSSEAGVRKPDRRIFDLALGALGLEPGEAAYVGDTVSRDVLGAKNAGLALSIQIRSSSTAFRDAALGEDTPQPDYLITAFDEIPRIVRAHGAKDNP